MDRRKTRNGTVKIPKKVDKLSVCNLVRYIRRSLLHGVKEDPRQINKLGLPNSEYLFTSQLQFGAVIFFTIWHSGFGAWIQRGLGSILLVKECNFLDPQFPLICPNDFQMFVLLCLFFRHLLNLFNFFFQSGWTPLHCAAQAGHLNVVKLLVESGAPTTAQTTNGRIPLW